MSQTAKAGRRTPLTLGSGKRKASTDSVEKSSVDSRSSTPVVNVEKINVEVSVDQLKTKIASAATTDSSTTKVKQSPAATAENGQKNGSKAEKSAEIVAKEEKPATKAVPPTTSSPKNGTEEKGKLNGNNKANTSGVAVPSKASTNGEKANEPPKTKEVVRESPRQKELLKTKEKEDLEKALEKKEIEEAVAAIKAHEEKESSLLVPPQLVVTPATPEQKKETPLKTPRKATETTPAKNTPSKDPNVTVDSKQFSSENDDMESLRMEPDFEDSPMPKSKGAGKILKLTQAPPPTRARISPFRRSIDKAQPNTSTLVNLSTVSEQSTEYGGISSPAGNLLSGEKTFGSSLRHISGRKSTRPLREMTFQHTMRESYRKISNELNDSISSMNATVGSEIPNDSFRTPVVAVRGQARKRTAAVDGDDEDMDQDEIKESPKKARLDFSGFLGFVASPVTMLRAKFSRTKIQCSTPNAQDGAATADVDVVDEIANVEANSVSGIESAEAENIADVDIEGSIANEVNEDDVDVEINEDANAGDDIKDKIEEVLHEPKKGRCSIM